MFKFLFLMLLLLAGIIGGPYLAGKQGYVLIQTEHYRIEFAITTLVIIFVASLAIVYLTEWIISKFLHLSSGSYTWMARRKRLKAQSQTLEGLMLLDQGDYQKAQKLIGKNAKHSEQPILNFIKAAEAAQRAGNDFDANHYLLQATDLAGVNDLLVEITRTKILLAQNKLVEATHAIDALLVTNFKNKEILKLAVDIYLQTEDYVKLDNILSQVEKSQIYNDKELNILEEKIETSLMAKEENAESLMQWWENQPNQRRKQSRSKLHLIQNLLDKKAQQNAYQVILDMVKKMNESSFNLYPKLQQQIIRLQISDNQKLCALLEKQAKKAEPYKTEIYRALGYLYTRAKDFKLASHAFDMVLQDPKHLQENDISMASYVFEQNDELEKAQQVRENYLQTSLNTALTIKK